MRAPAVDPATLKITPLDVAVAIGAYYEDVDRFPESFAELKEWSRIRQTESDFERLSVVEDVVFTVRDEALDVSYHVKQPGQEVPATVEITLTPEGLSEHGAHNP